MKKFIDFFIALGTAFVMGFVYLNNKIYDVFGYTISFTYSLNAPAFKEVIDTGLYSFSPIEIFLFWVDSFALVVITFYALYYSRNFKVKGVNLRIIMIVFLIIMAYSWQKYHFSAPSLQLPSSGNFINERKVTMLDTDIAPLPKQNVSVDLNVVLLLMESVNSKHFTSDYYPQVLSYLHSRPHYLNSNFISPGGETSISVPRIFHSRSEIGNQTFSCNDSYFRELAASGVHNYLYSAQIYHWLNLEALFICEPQLKLQTPPLIRKRLVQEKLLAKRLKGINLYELEHGFDDQAIVRTIKYDLENAAITAPYFLTVHFYGTHFPFMGVKNRIQANYLNTVGQFMKGTEAIKAKLKNDITDQYQQAVRLNDQNVFALIKEIEAHAQSNNQSILLAITSDHGEALGEHGYLLHAHDSPLFQELINVPLAFICLGPENSKCTDTIATLNRSRNDEYQSLTKLLPTLMRGQGLNDDLTPSESSTIVSQGYRSMALIEGSKKTLITPNKTLTFDLAINPDEK
ncbi:MAG: sulfatase-like hydrolase/transferase [Deltaproteobacteria bacterium]|nr:sulfatase-like hydrolase/transferase [Deltaproteobacteria bacterium]